jgi:hypothetical protein
MHARKNSIKIPARGKVRALALRALNLPMELLLASGLALLILGKGAGSG